MDRGSLKKVMFSAILVAGILIITELFASAALLLSLRLSNQDAFSKYELSYSSAINLIHKVGVQIGIFSHLHQVRISWEPEPHTRVDSDLGYQGIPGQYRVTYSRTVGKDQWQHLRVDQSINRDGTRRTGPFDPNYRATVYVFGDSFVYGEGVHDEHTFLLCCSSRDTTSG